jgi:hypothetical protein
MAYARQSSSTGQVAQIDFALAIPLTSSGEGKKDTSDPRHAAASLQLIKSIGSMAISLNLIIPVIITKET